MAQKFGLVQGMLVLRVLSRGEFHALGITQKRERLSHNAQQTNEGSLSHEKESWDWMTAIIARVMASA